MIQYQYCRFSVKIQLMWDERRVVKYLMKYHSLPILDLESKIAAIKDGVQRTLLFKHVMKEMCNFDIGDNPDISEDSLPHWQRVRYLVDECIEDGYLREIKRGQDEYILITSKGKKLARWQYFYLKFILEEFGDLKVIATTITVTVLTSPIWSPILKRLGSAILKSF